MFSKLRVKNFRSINDSKEINFSRLNVFVGPNNSGKSSLLYALLMLRQTLQDKDSRSTLFTSGPHVDLGSYLDIINGNFQLQVSSPALTASDTGGEIRAYGNGGVPPN